MEEARDNRVNWFVSARFDILFLAAFPTFLIVTLSAYSLYRYLPDVKAYNYLYTLFNFPHVIAGLSIVYIYTQEWKKNPAQFLWLPLIFSALMVVLLLLRYYKFMSILRAYWGCLHLFFQTYFIIWLYKLKNKDRLRVDNTIDTLFLICVYSDYAFRFLPFAAGQYAGYYPGLLAKYANYFLRNYWPYFVYAVAAAFALRQLYLYFSRKKIYAFKILMLSAVFINYYLLMRTGRSYIAQESSVGLHSLQWVFLVWFYHNLNYKEGSMQAPGFISYLFRTPRIILYLSALLLISVTFNYFTTFSMPRYHDLVHNPLALFHFFIEILIWRTLIRRLALERAR